VRPCTLSGVANEGELERWNDETWAGAWPQRERLTGAVTPFVVAAVGGRSGQRICDIGCGGAGLTIELAKAVGPDGRVVGYDLSAPLLQLARRRADESGVSNVEFVETDVQTGSWERPPFDVAASQFGVMFFDEPTAAFSAVRRHLVAGGRFVFACWQGVERNPWHLGTALRTLLPPPRVPAVGKSPVGPFALGDDEYVRELLEAAGYVTIKGTPHETSVRAPASAVVDRTLFPFMGISPDREDEAASIAQRHLDRFAVDGTEPLNGEDVYEFPLAFTIYDATAP
jgi:SAM-dependent methyltransferase